MGDQLLLGCGMGAIGVADTFSSTDGTMAKTAELSATGGLMGLGWVVSSISASGYLCARPSKCCSHEM